jgi:hypothetical protein
MLPTTIAKEIVLLSLGSVWEWNFVFSSSQIWWILYIPGSKEINQMLPFIRTIGDEGIQNYKLWDEIGAKECMYIKYWFKPKSLAF